MHYKNGTPAKIGDQVLFKDYRDLFVTGHVTQIQPGAKTCNLQVQPHGAPISGSNMCITASEAIRADQALAAYDLTTKGIAPAATTAPDVPTAGG